MTERETTQEQRVIGRPFQPGNPGRPKGSKNKLAEDFVADVHAAWQEHGKQAITDMIADKPGDFVKTVASLIPKETTLNINNLAELTDDELTDRIRALAAQLAPFLAHGDGPAKAGDEGEAGKALAARVH